MAASKSIGETSRTGVGEGRGAEPMDLLQSTVLSSLVAELPNPRQAGVLLRQADHI